LRANVVLFGAVAIVSIVSDHRLNYWLILNVLGISEQHTDFKHWWTSRETAQTQETTSGKLYFW